MSTAGHLLDGKVVLVHGATSGVGAGVARAAAAEGAAAVVVTGRRRELGEQLVGELTAKRHDGALRRGRPRRPGRRREQRR